jgi:AraC-like DNA-binding protein
MLPPQNTLLWSFSTRGMAPEASAAALRSLHERGTLPIEPLPDCTAHAEVSKWTLGTVATLTGRLGGLRQVAPRHARKYRGDVYLGMNVAGMAVAGQKGRELILQAGDAVLFPIPEAGFALSSPRSSRFLGLRLPHRLLAPFVPGLDRDPMRLIPGQTHSLRFLVDYLYRLGSIESPRSAELDRAIEMHIVDLVALSVGAHRDATAEAQDRGVRAARLQAIKADVLSHFSDGALSVAAVAARQTVTPRYVHKLFETEGTTFSAYLLACRLEFAHRMLTDRRIFTRSIASIAFDAGFSDLSSFNRMFRRRYGATPTEVRRAARS